MRRLFFAILLVATLLPSSSAQAAAPKYCYGNQPTDVVANIGGGTFGSHWYWYEYQREDGLTLMVLNHQSGGEEYIFEVPAYWAGSDNYLAIMGRVDGKMTEMGRIYSGRFKTKYTVFVVCPS